MTTIGKISVVSYREVEWQIENFYSYTRETTDKSYLSPKFSVSGSEWSLEVLPNGQASVNTTGFISLYLRRLGPIDSPPVGACYGFGVKEADGTVVRVHSNLNWLFEDDSPAFGFPRFLERSVLWERKWKFAPLSDLTLTCALRTQKDWIRSESLDICSRNFAELFTSKRDCDATLVVQGKEFLVHRLILSTQSPVLASVFEVEGTGVVEIPDCDPGAFGEFLTYLYSGKLEKDSGDPMQLYKIADKYGVEDLKCYCSLSIMQNLSTENVFEVLLLSTQFGEPHIVETTKRFFKKNFKDIIPTTAWDEFLAGNMTLANQLLKYAAK